MKGSLLPNMYRSSQLWLSTAWALWRVEKGELGYENKLFLCLPSESPPFTRAGAELNIDIVLQRRPKCQSFKL